MFRSFMALVSWGSAEPWILQELSKWHLEDFDCVQHSSLVDWTSLGNEAAAFNRAWRVKTAPPVHLCPSDLAESKNLREPRRWTGEVGVVLKQPEVAADECPLGAFTAAVMDLICASNCRPEHAVSQQLWSRALRFHRSETGETFANVPSSTGAAWLFGTSAWPVAQLLSKWASNCTQRLPKDPRAAPCSHQPLLAFRTALHRMADATLANVLEASGPKALIFDARLDHFASASLQVLRPRVAISAFLNTANEDFRTAALKWQQRKCCCCTSDSLGQLSQQLQIHWGRCEQKVCPHYWHPYQW